MQAPMLWNTLDDAALWLTDVIGQVYTAKQVLNLGLITYRDQFGKCPPTCLRAAPPLSTKFGMYHWDTKRGTPSNPMVRQHNMPWQPIPLYPTHLGELLASGETYVSIAKRPEDWDGQANQYVLIEPLDEPFRVSLSMIGITERDLVQLASVIKAELPAPVPRQDQEPPVTPLQRQRWQEDEILRVIASLNLSADSLPVRAPGKGGVKAKVREQLTFSRKVFDLAWERLRADGRIAESTSN